MSISHLPQPATRLLVRSADVAPADLLGLLPGPDHALAWIREGTGFVGWGQAARLEVRGPGRFEEADRWWRNFVARLDIEDAVGVPGSGPVAFVSMAFADHPAKSLVIVPEVVVARRDGRTWITTVGNVPRATRVRPVRRPSAVRYTDGQFPASAHQRAVREAVRHIRAGTLDKVVLAHDLVAVAEEPLDQRFVLRHLAEHYPRCWTYAVDGLVGATPELLLRRTGRVVESRVLAGTAWPGRGVSDDETEAALLSSAKDRREHAFAAESLVSSLQPFCTTMSVEGPHVLRLPNVQHLATDVTAELREPTWLLRLVEAVHPTAAVGGAPRDEATRLIDRWEAMDRGRYSGPVGWLDAHGNGECGIALRCAQFDGATARLFAGCGIVATSEPAQETREVSAKMRPLRDAVEGR
ncbi:chorismate-binding protein [Amycolatopsis sp. NBC_01307]|uniref:isochorismate synthase n=1 Tax=Amycolatopsis sp. NBC_01307 TaxID=2903561 RepID=UPI002E113D1F|nr:chorismate-binding protein [Amycolatopsis sp. NBC_01307]